MTPDHLRAIRQKLGLTQQQLAQLIGYRQAHLISNFETGTRPVPHLLAMLMRAFEDGYLPRRDPDASLHG